jgi:hypothetical protein
MNAGHGEFEVLCALAASGDLTKAEHAALREHLRHCLCCQNYFIEMRRLAIPLLLAQQLKAPGKQLQKGLQERFAERAIRSGIPLSPQSEGVGFSALGMVTVVLVVLLLVAATLQHASRSSVVDKDETGSAQVAPPLYKTNNIASLPAAAKVRRSRRERRSSSASSVAKPPLRPFGPATWSGHPFTLTLYTRNSARAYPLSATLKLTEAVPSLTFSYRAPGLTPDTAADFFRHNAPSEHAAFAPIRLRSNLASQSLDLDTYRNTWQANFKSNGFELIHNFAPEAAGQERSQ